MSRLFLALSLSVFVSSAADFSIVFPAAQSQTFDGRLFLLLSTDPSAEPRLQINNSPRTQLIFGMDVSGISAQQAVAFDPAATGYPILRLAQVPPGEYYAQAVLHRYETFHRADGHTVSLPMDRGEGQHWNLAPGNFYSEPRKITISHEPANVSLTLDREIPPITPPTDTKYVKHIRIKSKLLSDFWGHDMYLGAHILLPEGFETHPAAHYPLAIFHGHFPDDVSGFRTEPPDPSLKPDYSERFHISGYNRIQQQEAYKFYKQWTGAGFPRFLVVEIQHANPFYDDSYAVNSANLGPYGDAIETELIPYIETKFHGIGQGWARFVYGGSTGGWEALAVQMFYPEHYNGSFAACPDPVDFRAYTTIDLYKDKNAFYVDGAHKQVLQPGMRDYLGHTLATTKELMQFEAALGSKGRSGEQFDIWQAVYSPVGDDGYPKQIIDKETGEIDPQVAAYWREHYDLRYILERDWATLGRKLQGKIHIYCGSADTYFLNDAVYFMEDFLKQTGNPPYQGEVKYGDRAEHCWNGDPKLSNAYSRLHYDFQYLPAILKRIKASAPAGADLTSWRY
jgi:hypothetical protein